MHTIMTIYRRRVPANRLSWERRHNALTAKEVFELEVIFDKVKGVTKILWLQKRFGMSRNVSRLYRRFLIMNYFRKINPAKLNAKLTKLESKNRTIDSFDVEDIPGAFRFKSKEQLYDLIIGFRIPAQVRSTEGCVFSGEEMLLVALYRMRRPTTLTDIAFKEIFGFKYQRVSICVRTFVNYIISAWGYLLLNNMEYWKPHLQSCSTAIRDKLGRLGCEFPPPGTPGGFNVFSWIDNTMNATCRPGGGPRRDGVNAPRNDPLIQRAFYNGWKKLHGMKWQTVDLPNGMNFHVWGPVSIRRCDLFTLSASDINELIANLQVGDLYQFVMYGDSIYPWDTHLRARHVGDNLTARQILENRMMSSCRETIEWDYGNVGYMWKLLDYKHGLKIRTMPIGKLYLTAMILRNAYVTMNGCQTSTFFRLLPPSFFDWVAQGPQ